MKRGVIIFSIIAILLFIYIVMFISTDSIVKNVRSVMSGNVDASETDGTALSRYNNIRILQNAKVEVKVTRLLVLHNFYDGYMWVKYSYNTIKNDNDILPASTGVVSRWKIHRENGKWKIVEITENP